MDFENENTVEPSALSNILNAGTSGATSPSEFAQVVASHHKVPSGAESVVAQGLQASWNMGVTGSEEFMKATIRQHGRSAGAVLQDMQIRQAIEKSVSSAMSEQSIEYQIVLANDLKKYLHELQERLRLAAQSYQQKSFSLYEAGMMDEFQLKFEQEYVKQTIRSIVQVVKQINECDIPFIERYIVKLCNV